MLPQDVGLSICHTSVLVETAKYILKLSPPSGGHAILSFSHQTFSHYSNGVCLCVCVSVTLSVNSPTGQTPQRIFTTDSLKDADLHKDVRLVGLDDE